MSTILSVPQSQVAEAVKQDAGYRLLTMSERVTRVFGCRNHNYSWPRVAGPGLMDYPEGFDSHQTCSNCGAERFYNSQTLVAGPSFVRTVLSPDRAR